MKYCKRCVMPNTRPALYFDANGVCDACVSAEKRDAIDWTRRALDFELLVAWAKHEADVRGNAYDCIVPVSGGKDSTFQVLTCVKAGLRPLCVSFEPTVPTEIGRHNLDNLQRWADVVQFKKDREVYRRLGLYALRTVGDHEHPNHLGIFTVPAQFAVRFNIPLLVWGENPQTEYGGPPEARGAVHLDRRWLEEFGGLLGLRTADAAEALDLDARQLAPYRYPDASDLERVGVRGVFLGHFFRWDARAQVSVVREHGFEVGTAVTPGTYVNFENLDCRTTVWHDYLGFCKYGYGRASYHASIDIRNGRLTRSQAIDLVQRFDGKRPSNEDESALCRYFGITPAELERICDEYTNPAIFVMEGERPARDTDGNLMLRFPITAEDA